MTNQDMTKQVHQHDQANEDCNLLKANLNISYLNGFLKIYLFFFLVFMYSVTLSQAFSPSSYNQMHYHESNERSMPSSRKYQTWHSLPSPNSSLQRRYLPTSSSSPMNDNSIMSSLSNLLISSTPTWNQTLSNVTCSNSTGDLYDSNLEGVSCLNDRVVSISLSGYDLSSISFQDIEELVTQLSHKDIKSNKSPLLKRKVLLKNQKKKSPNMDEDDEEKVAPPQSWNDRIRSLLRKRKNKVKTLNRFGTDCLFNEEEMKNLTIQFRIVTKVKNPTKSSRNDNGLLSPTMSSNNQASSIIGGKLLMHHFIDIFSHDIGVFEDMFLLKRLFSLFETGNARNNPDFISFDRYSFIMSVIKKGNFESHLKLVFDVYDLDNDGFISAHDIFKLMRCDPLMRFEKDLTKLLQALYEIKKGNPDEICALNFSAFSQVFLMKTSSNIALISRLIMAFDNSLEKAKHKYLLQMGTSLSTMDKTNKVVAENDISLKLSSSPPPPPHKKDSLPLNQLLVKIGALGITKKGMMNKLSSIKHNKEIADIEIEKNKDRFLEETTSDPNLLESTKKATDFFKKMAISEGGTISRRNFHNTVNQTSHLLTNKLQDRVFSILDANSSGSVDFNEFMEGMLALVKGDIDSQLKFAFDLFDLDGGGTITAEEISTLLNDGLDYEDIDTKIIVDLVTSKVGLGNSDITFGEFKNHFLDAVRKKGSTAPVSKLLQRIFVTFGLDIGVSFESLVHLANSEDNKKEGEDEDEIKVEDSSAAAMKIEENTNSIPSSNKNERKSIIKEHRGRIIVRNERLENNKEENDSDLEGGNTFSSRIKFLINEKEKIKNKLAYTLYPV